MNLKELGDRLRAAGIRKIEIELFDPIPAPPPETALVDDIPEPENKGPGICIALGCLENNGWHFDTRFCAAHGRRAAGVKP